MLEKKIEEFKVAIEKYHHHGVYQWVGRVASVFVIVLQLTTAYCFFQNHDGCADPVHYFFLIPVFFVAYVITDFINGLIHMYMDNNTDYDSYVGPFVAAFHMHHKNPDYKNKNAIRVYFDESGAKLWLPFYLIVVVFVELKFNVLIYFNFLCLCFGILSSFAEVSHYWCHNATNKNRVIGFFQKWGVLLSKKHHTHHHVSDNVNYAFLNGVTDPLINKIAGYLYQGYKNNADQHVLAYQGLQTLNRT
jgi:uncharacterized membrane protein YecN with MAPEG domain